MKDENKITKINLREKNRLGTALPREQQERLHALYLLKTGRARRLTAIKLRTISLRLDKEGTGVVKKVNLTQLVNYHPPTPSLVRRGRTRLNLMAVARRLG